jgi:hypothetical protein
MDERAFGELTKRVAHAESRRGVLGAVLLGVSAPLLGVVGYARPAAAADVSGEVGAEVFGLCRVGGFPCNRNKQCCTAKCVPGTLLGQPAQVCTCAKKGKPCINRVGANCCSRACRKGKCK